MQVPAGAAKLGPGKFALASVGGAVGLVVGEFANAFIPPGVRAMGFWRINVEKCVSAASVLIVAGVTLAVTRSK